jgi:hypothetical protein
MPPRRHRPTPANPPRPPRTMASLSLRQRRLRSSPQATWTRSRSVRGSGAAPSTAPTRRACSVQIRARTQTTGRAMCRNTATRETTPTAAGWRRLSLGRCPMRSADCRAGRRSRKCTSILLPKTVCLEYRCSSLLALGAPGPCISSLSHDCRCSGAGLGCRVFAGNPGLVGTVPSAMSSLSALTFLYSVRPLPTIRLQKRAVAVAVAVGVTESRTLSWCVCTRCDSTAQSGPHGGRRAAHSLAAAHRTDDRWVGGGGCDRRSPRGGSCAAGGAGASRCDPSRLSQVCLFK